MSVKSGKDYLFLVWKEPTTRRQFTVGQLSKNGGYEFSYGLEIKQAIESGFKPLIAFEDTKITYKSQILFPVFSSRLPDKKRNGIEKILKKYELDEYDEYKLLKRSGARLPIDNLEFIDPILDLEDSPITRIFYLAGTRHYVGCDGDNCEKAVNLQVDEKLVLDEDKKNEYDENAIKILKSNGKHIGFVPRYYSVAVKKALQMYYKYECSVREVLQNNSCNECIKIKLTLKK